MGAKRPKSIERRARSALNFQYFQTLQKINLYCRKTENVQILDTIPHTALVILQDPKRSWEAHGNVIFPPIFIATLSSPCNEEINYSQFFYIQNFRKISKYLSIFKVQKGQAIFWKSQKEEAMLYLQDVSYCSIPFLLFEGLLFTKTWI